MPEMPGRPDYWNIGYPLLGTLVYSLLLVGAVAIVYALYKRVRMWRLGRPEPELGSWTERTKSFLTPAIVDILIHRRFVKRELYAGLMHLFIFTGMLVLFGATIIDALESNFHHWLPWDFPTAPFRLQEGLVWDIFGGGFAAIGFGMALYRRYVIRPPRLNTVLDDGVVLSILSGLIVTGFLVEGLRHAATLRNPASEFYAPGDAYWEPIGYVFSLIFTGAGVSAYATEWLHFWSWWFHAGLLAALFVYFALRFSKISHIIISPANIFLRPLRAKGALRFVPATDGVDEVGVGDITEFTWKQLLDLDACTNCGRCEDNCPAWASAQLLSPRKLMQDLRAYMEERSAQILGANGDVPAPARDMNREAVTGEVLWSCTTCRACMDVCPVFVNHVDAIVDMRRRLVYDGEMDAQLQGTLENLGRYGNSFGQSARRRARWTRDHEEEIKDATKEPVEYLWFVGDYASYDAGLPDITRATARVFQMAGLDFGILGADERNAGNDARRVGEEGLFEELVEQNAAALEKSDFKRIVTTDPHSLNTLMNEYPAYGHEWEVSHYTQVLADLLRDGRLKPRQLDYSVTYHDPCYLARYNGIHEEPREIMSALGLNLVEMPRSRDNTFCCGAGGGSVWMEDTPMDERPSEIRIREAVALGVDYLVTACPKDTVMFRDAIKTTDNEGKIEVKDLAELVEEACRADAPQEQETAAEPVG